MEDKWVSDCTLKKGDAAKKKAEFGIKLYSIDIIPLWQLLLELINDIHVAAKIQQSSKPILPPFSIKQVVSFQCGKVKKSQAI